MAYLGKVRLADIAPNHPFAHPCIIIGGLHPLKSKAPLPKGLHGVIVAVKWDDDWHALVISADRWRRIRHGERVISRTKYWKEGKRIWCHWLFDEGAECSLVMDYREDDGLGFNGDIRDATIVELGADLTGPSE